MKHYKYNLNNKIYIVKALSIEHAISKAHNKHGDIITIITFYEINKTKPCTEVKE